jgi:glycosyltransferase involved in cell wall biosynthesis
MRFSPQAPGERPATGVPAGAADEPLVAVVTPVHNGADSLAACLESVRAQRYRNWIHVVVDNASTDASGAIARTYAAADRRVVVRSFGDLVPMLDNFNRALAAVPAGPRYCKQLHADDTMDPECLRIMVAAAEREPAVALVLSRFHLGGVLSPAGAPRRVERLSGREVARGALLGTSNLLGNPSVPLLRIDRMADWPRLFNTARFPPGHPAAPPHNQGDKEGYLDTLAREDVLFVPEALVSLSEGGPSATSFTQRVGGWNATRVDLLLRRGAEFLDEAMLRASVRRAVGKWIRAVLWRLLTSPGRRDPEFCLYQRLCLDDLVPRLRDAGYRREAALLDRFRPACSLHAREGRPALSDVWRSRGNV